MHDCLTLGLQIKYDCNLHWRHLFWKCMLLRCCQMLAYFCSIAGFGVACHAIEHDGLAACPDTFQWLVTFSTCSFLGLFGRLVLLCSTCPPPLYMLSHIWQRKGWGAWLIVSRLNLGCRADLRIHITCDLWGGLGKGPVAFGPLISFHFGAFSVLFKEFLWMKSNTTL